MKRLMSILIMVVTMFSAGLVYAEEQVQPNPPSMIEQAQPAQSAPEAAAPAPVKAEDVQTNANYLWTLIAAFLVFFMQAGFAMVETGFTRAKNAVNIMMKNLMDFSMGSIAYWAVGFGIMFGASATGWFGTNGFFFSDFATDQDPWLFAFWMFQVVFAATAATIVSGAMAERTKFVSYLVYSAVISGLIYPIFGSWAWGSLFHGGGWLEKLGFIDFAGSTVVHSIGGWAALAGALVLGPRIGKYGPDGKAKAIPGHNIPLAALGVFILWFGWFGFNPGSTTAATTDIAKIAVNTNLAAAAGTIGALMIAWIMFRKPDASMTLNGSLAGLVAITAGCNNVTPTSAVILGFIAGIIVVLSVVFIDKVLKVDDPVGAVSVHGVCGAWGTLAAGLFNADGVTMQIIGVQALGIAVAFAWSFTACFILFKVIKATVGLRVSAEEEMDGLDMEEHGNMAYPDFQIHPSRTYIGSPSSGGHGVPELSPVRSMRVSREEL
jgi:Amt family ammonium transporter